MLHIILLILKIIGIVLAVVLGMLFLVLISVLFVPVRYRIRAERQEGDDSPPVEVYVKVTWLLHLVNVLVRYPGRVAVRVRILVFTLFRLPQKEKKPGRERKPKKEPQPSESMEPKKEPRPQPEESTKTKQEQELQPEESAESGEEQEQKSEAAESGQGPQPDGESAESKQEPKPQPKESAESGQEQEPPHKDSFPGKIKKALDKIKAVFEKIKAFFQNIQYTIRNICDKIKNTSDTIHYYREVLESEIFRSSLQQCRGELGWVFRKLKPDRFEADLIVGMEDPAATGEILAIYGMLYPLIGQSVRVAGDFECDKTRVEGRFYMRGRIRAFTFIRAAVRLYFNKDIRKLIRLLKKEAV